MPNDHSKLRPSGGGSFKLTPIQEFFRDERKQEPSYVPPVYSIQQPRPSESSSESSTSKTQPPSSGNLNVLGLKPFNPSTFSLVTESCKCSYDSDNELSTTDEEEDFYYSSKFPNEPFICSADKNVNCCADSDDDDDDGDDDDVISNGSSSRQQPGAGWATISKAGGKKAKIGEKKCPCDDHVASAGKSTSTSYEMKTRALDRRISEVRSMQLNGCNNECTHGRRCLDFIDFEIVTTYVHQFWGTRDDEVKRPKQRLEAIKSIFERALGEFDKKTKKLTFTITDKFGKSRAICEAALLYIIGYIDSPNASDASMQWQLYKRLFTGVSGDRETENEFKQTANKVKKTRKRMHAESYIKSLVEIYFGETIASLDGANSDGTSKNIKILPYENPTQLFEEYTLYCEIQGTPLKDRAHKTCFCEALKSLQKRVRLLGCKGSFPTCDVCNTALEMLRDTKRWDRAQRDIILKFRRLHLKQQQIEREYLESVKARARRLNPHTGQPVEALIFSDAMTSTRGNTPKVGVVRHSKPGKTILNRVFGTQVICGPVEFMIYISVDQMVMGGANLAIEIQRMAMEKLSVELEQRCLLLPKIMNFQFDNCGENKNKEMFCYASLMVELGYFDEFNINFLVVGHTHCNLDQTFSVLSKRIFKAPHILSPLAMRDLIGIAHKDPSERPKYNLQLELVHDYKSIFGKFVNKSLKFYQVPHRFRIRRFCGRAIFQYMLFTPPAGGADDFLPKIPDGILSESQMTMIVQDVQVLPLGVIDGRRSLEIELGLTNALARSTAEERATQGALERTMGDILNLELEALSRQFSRMELQRVGDNDPDDILSTNTATKADIQKKMRTLSNQDVGFITWLDFSRASAVDSAVLLQRPPLLPKLENIEQLEDANLDDLDDNVNPNAPVSAKLACNARTIAAVARRQLDSVAKGSILLADANDKRHIHEITGYFKNSVISAKEFDWFNDHNSCEKVLNNLRNIQLAARSQEFKWLRISSPDPARLTENLRAIMDREQAVTSQCKALLVRRRQDRQRTEEIIARPGLLNPDVVAEAAAAAAVNAVQLPRFCIASENGISDCGAALQYQNCSTCQAICCSLHGPEHVKHEYFSSDQRMENQRTAVRNLQQQRDIATPQAAPIVRAAEIVSTANPRNIDRMRTTSAQNTRAPRVTRPALSKMNIAQILVELREVHLCPEVRIIQQNNKKKSLIELLKEFRGDGHLLRGLAEPNVAGIIQGPIAEDSSDENEVLGDGDDFYSDSEIN